MRCEEPDLPGFDDRTIDEIQLQEEDAEVNMQCEVSDPPGFHDGTIDDSQFLSSICSQNSEPGEEASIWCDEKELQNEGRQKLNDALGNLTGGRFSPILSTLNASWEDISITQQKYYARKAREAVTVSLSVICPGQEKELWNSIRNESIIESEDSHSRKRKKFDTRTGLIDVLIKAHDQAESWRTKRQILSLFANDLTKAELQRLLPGLTKWRIDQARLHANEVGRGQLVPEEPIFRTRIDPVKVDHFINYISRPDLLQDVAFGTKTLKLDSGERIIIPAVIRTLIPSRIIEQYTSYCKQQEFEPASERSLFRMLEICSASMQKSLQGLDNITAEGSEAFDSLLSMTETLKENGADDYWVQEMVQTMKEAKRYLKTDFKTHVGRDEKSSDHCIVYSLSDPTNLEFSGDCQHSHDIGCERCESLDHMLEEITNKLEEASISEDHKARMKFESRESTRAVQAWKAHLARSVTQEEAKQGALSQLDDETCLIVVDWAMKYLPQRYREQMSEFFGKRGRSWHVSAVITHLHNEERYEVECFVHLLNNCNQNSFAVMSVIEHLLHTIKQEYPLINKAFLRSDNAGCYHNGPLILSLPYIGERTGIKPLRYDYSDPQAGKDICDRKTAPMKAHIRRWVNEKHNVITAEDMKQALESHSGLKGCRAAVVEVDASKETGIDNKISGISFLNNFQFEENGIRAWKAYNVGPGRLLSYSYLIAEKQGDTGLKVIQPFGPRTKQRGTVSESARPNTEIFSCSETGCVLTFKTEKEAEAHMDSGKHVRKLESESLYDSIRKKWAEKITGVNAPSYEEGTSSADHNRPSSSITNIRPKGWALKTTKKPVRMTDRVKSYLVQKFDAGARSGLKADPVQVSREMKFAKDENGHSLFTPEEWRTAQQITSFFSRLAAVQRQKQVEESPLEDANEEIAEEDLEALESEIALDTLRIAVLLDTNVPRHPVQVGSKNICELSRANKFNTLKIAELREICQSLQLTVAGSPARKKSFIEPLEAYVKTCTCFQ